VSYRNRKTIDLPSGAKALVRGLSGLDLLCLRRMVSPDLGGPAAKATPATSASSHEDELKIFELALTKCLAWIEEGGQRLTPAAGKPWQHCGEAEISVDEIQQADAKAIYDAVIELSGFGKEAAEGARPFPEQPPASG
jgi:hypothetical protein